MQKFPQMAARVITATNETAWETIGQALLNRRDDLGLSQWSAAKKMRVGTTLYGELEGTKSIGISPGSALKVDKFVGWARGSTEKLLALGEEPQLLDTSVASKVLNCEDRFEDLERRVNDLEDNHSTMSDLVRRYANAVIKALE